MANLKNLDKEDFNLVPGAKYIYTLKNDKKIIVEPQLWDSKEYAKYNWNSSSYEAVKEDIESFDCEGTCAKCCLCNKCNTYQNSKGLKPCRHHADGSLRKYQIIFDNCGNYNEDMKDKYSTDYTISKEDKKKINESCSEKEFAEKHAFRCDFDNMEFQIGSDVYTVDEEGYISCEKNESADSCSHLPSVWSDDLMETEEDELEDKILEMINHASSKNLKKLCEAMYFEICGLKEKMAELEDRINEFTDN